MLHSKNPIFLHFFCYLCLVLLIIFKLTITIFQLIFQTNLIKLKFCNTLENVSLKFQSTQVNRCSSKFINSQKIQTLTLYFSHRFPTRFVHEASANI